MNIREDFLSTMEVKICNFIFLKSKDLLSVFIIVEIK